MPSATPKAPGPAPATWATSEERIEHVIVLMLENRSFDHMLGYLDHPDKKLDGLRFGTYYNESKSNQRFDVSPTGRPDLADPDHSHGGVLMQLGGFGDVPPNGGFVRSYEAHQGPAAAGAVMQCLDPNRYCPVLAQLATEFAVCDAWFCSVPGETWPNRNFAHAATSDGASNIEYGLYYDPTIFELLHSRGASWRIYHHGPPQAWCFRRLWQKPSWFERLLGHRETLGHWYGRDEFFDHVRRRDLPAYAFIEPTHMLPPGVPGATNSQHPHNNRHGSDDFYAGEALILQIYNALLEQPELFARTLLLITYDEHGGFYDHVSPGLGTPPGDRISRSPSRGFGLALRDLVDRLAGRRSKPADFDFRRLGVRVPAVLISPWIAPGTVVHRTLEHASIPHTLRALFAPKADSLTKRDEAADTFHGVVREFGLEAPRRTSDAGDTVHPLPRVRAGAPPVLPPSAALQAVSAAPTALSDFERQLVELSGQVRRQLERQGDVPAIPTQADEISPTAEAQLGAATDTASLFAAAARRARS